MRLKTKLFSQSDHMFGKLKRVNVADGGLVSGVALAGKLDPLGGPVKRERKLRITITGGDQKLD